MQRAPYNQYRKAYVDDTEFWLTIPDCSITQLAAEMQDIAQHWEQLLFTTGGALALEKWGNKELL